jgi:hypothetical protein
MFRSPKSLRPASSLPSPQLPVLHRAQELPQNLGPVVPHEPILTDVGHKRVLAWYEPDSVGCAVHAMVWNRADVEGTSTEGIRIRLNRGQIVHFDSAYPDRPLRQRL